MKRYYCKACSEADDSCIACVPTKTPDDFDKSIMNVLCKKKELGNPKWERLEYYYETF